MVMSQDKLLELLARYEGIISVTKNPLEERFFPHLKEMLPQMYEFIRERRNEKLMRWLGFIQGTFHVCGTFTLSELKEHNRPREKKDG